MVSPVPGAPVLDGDLGVGGAVAAGQVPGLDHGGHERDAEPAGEVEAAVPTVLLDGEQAPVEQLMRAR